MFRSVGIRWLWWINGILMVAILLFIVGYSPSRPWRRDLVRRSISSENEECVPKKNIMFLKTHKCASSSVQNILLRYAKKHDLTVVLPKGKSHYLAHFKPFNRTMIAGAPWEKLGYNIMCHHMTFNQKEVEAVMPKDTIYISILRDPVSLFESVYEYGNLSSVYKLDIDQYAKATENVSKQRFLKRRKDTLGYNQMLFDFGVTQKQFSNITNTQFVIKQIEERFDLILIAERFDESIILLKHLLCWDIDDVVGLTLNARLSSFKNNLSEETANYLRKWNSGDQMLYSYFLNKFNSVVKLFGEEAMRKEVELLKKRREEWFTTCVDREIMAADMKKFKMWSTKVKGFVLKSGLKHKACEDFVKPERLFTNEIRHHQILRSAQKKYEIRRIKFKFKEIGSKYTKATTNGVPKISTKAERYH